MEKALTAADGHRIRNVFHSCGSRDLLILAHGIDTEKDEGGIFSRFAEEVIGDTFDSIRFDFRGHGQSNIKPIETTISGEILDLMAVLGWASSQAYDGLQIVAASFGASITLLALMGFDLSSVQSIVMWNPVINYRNTFIESTVEWGREFFNQSSVNELAIRSFTPIPESNFKISPRMTVEMLILHPEQAARNLSKPFLVIHGSNDTMVPASDARSFCIDAGRPSAYQEIPGVDHGFEDKIEMVYSLTRSWLFNHRSLDTRRHDQNRE